MKRWLLEGTSVVACSAMLGALSASCLFACHAHGGHKEGAKYADDGDYY